MITNSFQDLCNKLLCWHIPLVQRIGTHAQKPWLEFLSSLGRGQVQENIFLFPDDICFLSLIKATGVATTWHTEGSTVKATSCSWTHGNVFFFFPDTLRLEDYKIRLKLICHFGESLLKLNHSERGCVPGAFQLWVLEEVEARWAHLQKPGRPILSPSAIHRADIFRAPPAGTVC